MRYGYLTPWRSGSLASGSSYPSGGSLFDLHQQVNRLFDEMFDQGSGRQPAGQGSLASSIWPQLDIEHDDKQIHVVVELPGVDEKDIDVQIEDGVLTLSGEKRSERKDEGGYSERSYGRFERRISLPTNVDEEKCAASFSNGVLRVTIPRAEEKSRGRRIPLGSGRSTEPRLEAGNDAHEPPRQQAAQESARQAQQPENQQS